MMDRSSQHRYVDSALSANYFSSPHKQGAVMKLLSRILLHGRTYMLARARPHLHENQNIGIIIDFHRICTHGKNIHTHSASELPSNLLNLLPVVSDVSPTQIVRHLHFAFATEVSYGCHGMQLPARSSPSLFRAGTVVLVRRRIPLVTESIISNAFLL